MVYNQADKCMGGHAKAYPPFLYRTTMINTAIIVLIIKYMVAISIFIGIVCAPAWIARQTDKGKQDMCLVRLGSWLFGWSIVGWFYALVVGTKK